MYINLSTYYCANILIFLSASFLLPIWLSFNKKNVGLSSILFPNNFSYLCSQCLLLD